MAKLHTVLQIPPQASRAMAGRRVRAAGSIRGHCSLNTTYPGWGLCGQGDPPPKPLGTREYPFPSGERPGTFRVYLDALSSPAQPWVSSHRAGTHTNEACSGTNCDPLAYNKGASRRDLDIF